MWRLEKHTLLTVKQEYDICRSSLSAAHGRRWRRDEGGRHPKWQASEIRRATASRVSDVTALGK